MALATLLFSLVSCATTKPQICRIGEQPVVSDWLYFGTAKSDGVVTPSEWQAFVTREISPRFPEGLTFWPTSGQWIAASGELRREQSYVLNVVHPDGERPEGALREIIARYRTEFRQESVLRARATVCTSR